MTAAEKITKALNESTEATMSISQIAGAADLFTTEVRHLVVNMWADGQIESRTVGRELEYYTVIQ